MRRVLAWGAWGRPSGVWCGGGGFAPAGVSGGPAESARGWMIGLLVCFGVMAAAALYMALVGLYHTVLALFGWDGGPGILRKNPHYVPGSDEPLPDGTGLPTGKD